MAAFKDLTGQRFGRLVVIQRAEKRKYMPVMWICRCDCGQMTELPAKHLTLGMTKSCGCLWRESSREMGRKYHQKKREQLDFALIDELIDEIGNSLPDISLNDSGVPDADDDLMNCLKDEIFN